MNERGMPRHAAHSSTDHFGHRSFGQRPPEPLRGPGRDTGYRNTGPRHAGPPAGRAQATAPGAAGAGADWAPTDWFTPVSAAQTTAVGVLDRPERGTQQLAPVSAGDGLAGNGQAGAYPAQDHPSFPPGTLEITPDDVREALGPNADDVLATAEVDVDEVIRLINEETTVLPPLVIPDTIPEGEVEGEPSPEMAEAISTWKQRFLKGAVAAVIVTLTGSGGAAAAMDKSVKLDVDGHETTVNTYDSTVGEVLEEEGIQVGPHDALSPSPASPVGQGDSIKLDRGRLLKLNVDGQHREEWVRSVNVDQALRQLGVPADDAWVSADRNQPVPEQGMELTVNTQKSISLTDGGGETKQLDTHAVTVQDLVKEQNLNLGPQDSVTPGAEQRITDGVQVQVNRTGSTVVNVTQPVDPPVQEIPDESMFQGEEKVEKQGQPGEKIVFTRIAKENGEETDRTKIDEKVTKQPTPTVKKVGKKSRPDSAIWDKIVQCEATGNWNIASGNGYFGGLQFDKKTWDANGGSQFAPYPHQATREQQIQVAEKVRDGRGGSYGAWPGCAKKLGLET